MEGSPNMPRRREKGDEMVSQRELVLASIMRDNQKDVTPIRPAPKVETPEPPKAA